MKGAVKARQSVRTRCQSRQHNRLASRQASHETFPVSSDGKEWAKGKIPARKPGSPNPRKH